MATKFFIMKAAFVLCFTFLHLLISAQDAKTDMAKTTDSKDRKEILEGLKKKVQPDLKLLPKLVVKHLYVKDGFAYFVGHVKDSNGKDIDFRKTAYKNEVEAGVFDGDNTNALLKKSGNKWKVLTFVIGPSDVPWGCWWKEFNAPKEIFNYAEKECSWVEKN